MIVLGGANAVGIFISTNMTAILIVLSLLYLIRLLVLSFVNDLDCSTPSKAISVLLQLAESAFAVFVCYKALLYLVVVAGEKGFFGFGIEIILWALLIVAPILAGTAIGTVLSWDSSYAGVPVSSICYLISFFLSLDP